MKRIAAFLLALPLSGCFLAQDYLHTLSPSYSYGARWVKAGMTQQSRLADWVACGGSGSLGGAEPSPMSNTGSMTINGPLRTYSKQALRAQGDYVRQLGSCMQSKGYAYRSPQRPGKPDECTASACMYP